MYTLEFYPEQETIGTLVALKDGVAIFKESVNLGDEGSVDKFIEQVKGISTKETEEAVKESKVDTLLADITSKLNK